MLVNFSPQDVDASEIKVQVCVYAFDLLYLNGEVRHRPDPCHLTLHPFSAARVYCLRALTARLLL